MKQNAGAVDLPRDAMRRQFAEDLVQTTERSERVRRDANIDENHNLTPVLKELQRKRRQSSVKQQNNVVIDAPLQSSSASVLRRSERVKGNSAPVVGNSPEKQKRQPTQVKDIDTQEEGGGGISGATPREEAIKKERG